MSENKETSVLDEPVLAKDIALETGAAMIQVRQAGNSFLVENTNGALGPTPSERNSCAPKRLPRLCGRPESRG